MLGVRASSDNVRLADGGRRMVRINIRAVEKPKDELFPQQPPHRDVNAFLSDPTLLHELHDKLGTCLAAKLVAASIQDHSTRDSSSKCSTPQARAGIG
jgi:hypothetical protein